MRFSLLLLVLFLAIFLVAQIAQTQEENKESAEQSRKNDAGKTTAVQGFAGMGMLTTIWLKWNAYEADGFPVAGYKIYRKAESGEYGRPIKMLGLVTSWTDFNLEKGKKYFYKISAYSPDGKETELSGELPVETALKPPFQPFIGELKIQRIPNLDVLCVIYGEMTKEESERIRKGIEEARLFLWRNSRCSINLDISYIYIGENNPNIATDGMNEIENDLRKRGYSDDQFAFVFIAAPEIKEIKGGLSILANTTAGIGWKSKVPYPGADISVEYEIVWAFTKAFCESLDLILANSHLSPIFKNNISGGYKSLANKLTTIGALDDLKAPYNSYIEVFDADNDGIPDNDERVLLDEVRLPSDARYKDSDNDFLDDINEMIASIWKSSNNLERDTDGDKLIDGKDLLPFVDFQSVINSVKFVPSIDGKIEETWKALSKGCFWSTTENPKIIMYAGWDDSNLYIAAKSDEKRDIILKIIDPATEKTLDYLLLWESKEVLLNQRIPYKKGVPLKIGSLAHWIGDDGTFQTEASIPMEKESFILEKGKKIFIQLYLINPKKDYIWVTEFDNFYEVTLE